MPRESTLTIERLANVYSVASDLPMPEEVRARLDRVVSTQAVDACRRRLAPLLSESDSSVWLIRALDITLAIDASPYVLEQAGASWGEQLGTEIQRVLEGNSIGGSVLRFADRAAYLAQWVRDMAGGRAWEKWYYTEFASLGSLPQSAAIAEGILQEGDEAESTLMRLASQGNLEAVLEVLSDSDAGRIYDCVLPRDASRFAGPGRWASRLLSLWSGLPLSFSEGVCLDALRLYAAARAGSMRGDDNLRELRHAIDGLLQLRLVLGGLSPGAAQRFLAAATTQQYETARRILEEFRIVPANSLFEFIAFASDGDPRWGEFAAAILSPLSSADGQREESVLSELGGIFLLAKPSADLGIGEAIWAASQTCDEPSRAAPLLRRLFGVRCLGRARASLSIGDPALAIFAHAPRSASLAEMARALGQADTRAAMRVLSASADGWGEAFELTEQQIDYFSIGRVFPELQLDADRDFAWSTIAAAVFRDFARRLPGFGLSSPEYIFQNFLAGTSEVRVCAGRIEVRLPRSPLTVVLHIAGAYQTVPSPWQEGIELCLLAPPG